MAEGHSGQNNPTWPSDQLATTIELDIFRRSGATDCLRRTWEETSPPEDHVEIMTLLTYGLAKGGPAVLILLEQVAMPSAAEQARESTAYQTATGCYERLRGNVYRYLVAIGLEAETAQEATQEVFLRFYVALRKGEDIVNPQAWIFRVAHNWGIKVRAKERGRPGYGNPIKSEPVGSGQDPERQVLARERDELFRSAIAELSEQQRNCLFLRLQGLRYSEIAQALGIAPTTVSEFLRRAIARFRRTAL